MEHEGIDVESIKIDDLLQDPELLSELHELGWDNTSTAHRNNKGDDDVEDELLRLENEVDESHHQATKMYGGNPPPPNNPTPQKQTIVSPLPPSNNTAAKTVISSPPISSSSNNIDINSITVEEAKRRALSAKRAGNDNEALQWFRIAKSKEQTQPNLNGNTSPTTIPSTMMSNSSFQPLEKALLEACNKTLNEAKKLRNSDDAQAVIKMREYKKYEQDLNTCRARAQISGSLPPTFRWQLTRKTISLERLEIAESDLKLSIEGLYEIDGLLSSHSSKTLSLSIQVTGSSTSSTDTKAVNTTTSQVKYTNGKALFNFDASFPIIKRTKLAQQSTLRKKITILITLHRGFLFSSINLAMAVLNLTDLATKSQTEGKMPLYLITTGEDGSLKKGKAVGGYLQMSMAVRKPIGGPEVQVIEEQLLVIDPWPTLSQVNPPIPTATTTTKVTSSATSRPVSTTVSSSTTSSSSSSAEQPSKGNASILATTMPATTGNTKQIDEKDINDPFRVDLFDSNDVLEHEIEIAKNALAQNTLDEDQLYYMNLRLQLLQIRLQSLVAQVQNELISLEDYLNVIQERIKKDTQLALHFKSLNTDESKEIAVKIMQRIKIMQEEVKNAQDMGQEG
jgi:hypothetical protein